MVREVIELNVRHELTAGPARSGAGSARGLAIALAGHQARQQGPSSELFADPTPCEHAFYLGISRSVIYV